MPSSTFTPFQDFPEQRAKGVHVFGTHAFKVALTNTAPNPATNERLADIAQIAAGGGYTAGAGGGYAVANAMVSQSGATVTFTHDDLVITANGGSVGPFRYLVLYNDTATGDPLVGYFDYGSALTLAATETLTLDIGASGFLQDTIV